MIHLRSVSLKKSAQDRSDFPFSLELIRSMNEITFTTPLTFLVGENGSGKSTLIEGIAAALRLPAIGGNDIQHDPTLHHARELGNHLRLVWNKQTHRGFFLRAEDFFNFARRLNATKLELDDMVQEYEGSLQGYGLELARNAARGQQKALQHQYGGDLEERSHGESFLDLFRARFAPNGLYILDEPEAPLSPRRQYALMFQLADMLQQNAQFIIATHSPILLSYPGAQILSIADSKLCAVEYAELDHVQFTRSFLENPKAYLRHLHAE